MQHDEEEAMDVVGEVEELALDDEGMHRAVEANCGANGADQLQDDEMRDDQMQDDQTRDDQMKNDQMRDDQLRDDQLRDDQMLGVDDQMLRVDDQTRDDDGILLIDPDD